MSAFPCKNAACESTVSMRGTLCFMCTNLRLKELVQIVSEDVKGTAPPQPLKLAQALSQLYPKYYKDVRGFDEMDVYAVHYVFRMDDPAGCLHHASKKLLLSGVRTGGKSKFDDIREARDTLNRWLELNQANQGAQPTKEVSA